MVLPVTLMTSKSTLKKSKHVDDSNIVDDTHDLLIKEVLAYLKWGPRFDQFGYKESAVRAKRALRNIRYLAHERGREIQAKKRRIWGEDSDPTESQEDE